VIVPLAAMFLRAPPELPLRLGALGGLSAPNTVMGWPPNLVFALIGAASIFCCIPMAMPQAHLPALCSDLGILVSHGAAMLSVLLGTAFVSRQLWGWVSDRMGGLNTVLTGSICQILAMAAFMFTQDEIGLFTVSGVRPRLCRHHPRLCAGDPRAVSRLGSILAHSGAAFVQWQWHGARWMDCGRAL
jgi:hypothetical protein